VSLPDLSEAAWKTLAALCDGVEFDLERGMAVKIPGKGYVEVGDEIDELTGRGWVEVTDEGVVVTEKGRYWCRRRWKQWTWR
jgi:hypothetical protein